MPRKVEDWIEGFLEYTSNTEPRESYRRWVAISTIASALQRKCRLVWGTETFYPNEYIILVGPPAARKGTAMRAGKYFLDRLGIPRAADESSRQKLVKSLKEAMVPDATNEGRINYHASLSLQCTELTVFLGYDSKELISMLCKWYDCEDRYIYDTIQRGKEEIANVWVNLLGATTPGQLQAALPIAAISSGFTSRIVFVYEEDKERMVIEPFLTPAQQVLEEDLYIDLGEIRSLCGDFTVDTDFRGLYTAWRTDSESRQLFADSRLDYYVQRRPTHLFKLAMICSAARRSDLLVTRDDLASAIAMLENVERKMINVFRGVGANPLASVQMRVMSLLEVEHELSLANLQGQFFSDVSRRDLGEVLSTIEAMGLCHIDMVKRRVVSTKQKSM